MICCRKNHNGKKLTLGLLFCLQVVRACRRDVVVNFETHWMGLKYRKKKKKCITGHTHSTFVTYGPYGINFCAQVCPNCGRVYAYDAQYCRHCGQKREARDVKMLPLLNGPYSVLTVLYRRWNSSDKFLTSNRKNNANAYTKPDSCLQQLVITIFKILNDI